MAKPTVKTEWATDATALKSATESPRWLYGWMTSSGNSANGIGEKPNLNHQNYWQNAVHTWVVYLTAETDALTANDVLIEADIAALEAKDILIDADVDALETRADALEEEMRTVGAEIPAATGHPSGVWNHTEFLNHNEKILNENKNVSEPAWQAIPFTHVGAWRVGGVYSPYSNTIFMNGGYSTSWGTINCDTGVQENIVGPNLTSDFMYSGCIYTPNDGTIFFAPSGSGPDANWYYLDSRRKAFFTYSRGATAGVTNAYSEGAYCPTNNRVYFAPDAQTNTGHAVDASSKIVYTYTLPTVYGGSSYYGAVYCPVLDRVYFVPYQQATQTNWHYMDCASGLIVPYPHGSSAVIGAYKGGVYSPKQARIYLIPSEQASEALWHYIDCATGNIVSYANTTGITGGSSSFADGCYHPILNRIYMNLQSGYTDSNSWFIDCDTGNISYLSFSPQPSSGEQNTNSCVYSPTENRMYFINSLSNTAPAADLFWPYLRDFGNRISPEYASNTLINNGG